MLLPPTRRRSVLDAKVAAAYLAGTSAGALLTALVAWVLSGFAAPLGDEARLALLGAGGAFVWAAKHGPLERLVRLPEARRQIPSHVFGAGRVRGAWSFGLELGTGVRTYVPSAAPYVLLLVVVITGPALGEALLIGLGFGIARALPVLARLVPWPARAHVRVPAPGTAATLVVLAGGLLLV